MTYFNGLISWIKMYTIKPDEGPRQPKNIYFIILYNKRKFPKFPNDKIPENFHGKFPKFHESFQPFATLSIHYSDVGSGGYINMADGCVNQDAFILFWSKCDYSLFMEANRIQYIIVYFACIVISRCSCLQKYREIKKHKWTHIPFTSDGGAVAYHF